MRILGLLLAVGIVAIFQLYVAIPIGVAGNLDPVLISIAAWIGGMAGVVAFVYFGPTLVRTTTRAARWVRGRPEEDDGEPETDAPAEQSRVRRYAERFGEPFLGVVGPMTIGGWAAAVLGTSMGMSRSKLIVWLGVGQAAVVIAYTAAISAIGS